MWVYKPEDPATILRFYRTTHDKLWKVLFNPQKDWPAKKEDIGLDASNPPKESWLEKAVRIDGPTPLPEGPRTTMLTEMLVEAPYKAPEKKVLGCSGEIEREKTQVLLAEKERESKERTTRLLEEERAQNDASNRAMYELIVTMYEKAGQDPPPMPVITTDATNNSLAASHDPSAVPGSAPSVTGPRNPDASPP